MKAGIETRVLVPLFQAVVTGFLLSFLVLAGCVLWGWEYPWAGVVGGGVTFFSWLLFRGEQQAGDRPAERVQLNDEPTPEPEPVRAFQLAITYDSGKAGDYMSLPVTWEKFTSWCSGVAGGKPLAEGVWTGSHGLFSKSEYHALREQLVERGFMRLNGKHHSQGFSLTGKGSALVRGVGGVARTQARARTPITNNASL